MRTLSRRLLLALGGAALAAPGVAFAQSAPAIKMAGVPEDSATPALYGIASGLFKKRGLEVEIETQHNGPAVMSGVAGNSYQIGKASTPPLAAAVSKGLSFVMVAAGGLYTANAPIAGLLVKADSSLKKPSDIAGKTIGVGALNDVHSLAVRAWLDKLGIDSASVRFTEIPISEIPVAIEQGRIDAGSANEPVFSAAQAGGKLRVLAHHFDAIAPRFMYTSWFSTREFVAQNGPAVKAFSQAMSESARYCNAHHDQTIEMIAKYTSLEIDAVRHMARVEQGTSMDPKLVQPVVDAMARYKFVPRGFDAAQLMAPGLS
jgi:NitT/TauT family transport system substrate-binding protein